MIVSYFRTISMLQVQLVAKNSSLITKLLRKCGFTRKNHNWSAKVINESFQEFFQKQGHNFVKSSSVIPWNDQSLFFVNAGMNQFKPELLGKRAPRFPRAVNIQKCIRIGGKHNDLASVGTDSYHHTFFEMLGSWSFDDYFKEEACRLAWQLLTEVYRLDPGRLFVTYFAGAKELGLPEDLETRHIWANLGVPSGHILPFGMTENFWEMGSIGPCGPCTELHYYRGEGEPERGFVNAGNEQLIELWNIVFIQYQRHLDGSLTELPRRHVDTGMGLERLTATLNGKFSNYDTDLFLPIFKTIQKVTGAAEYSGSFTGPQSALDTGYRVVADHARMAVVAVADGALPNAFHNVRKVLNRMYRTMVEVFEMPISIDESRDWMGELVESVSSTLYHRYPEVLGNIPVVQKVLASELAHFASVKISLLPSWQYLLSQEPRLVALEDRCSQSLLQACNKYLPDIQAAVGTTLPTSLALRLNNECGVTLDVLKELAEIFDVRIDEADYNIQMAAAKRERRSKTFECKWHQYSLDAIAIQLRNNNVQVTNRDPVYRYTKDGYSYKYQPLRTQIVAIVSDGNLVHKVPQNCAVGLVTAATNFYHNAGGQVSDTGMISISCENSGLSREISMEVVAVEEVDGYVVHWGFLPDAGEVHVGADVQCCIDANHRQCSSANHTATHLLMAALRSVSDGPVSQLSSNVSSEQLVLGVGSYKSINHEQLVFVQEIIREWIRRGGVVKKQSMPLSEALSLPSLNLVPGAVYPDTVTVVTSLCKAPSILTTPDAISATLMNLESVEVCCGTHLYDVADLQEFCIVSAGVSEGLGLKEIAAVTGEKAKNIFQYGAETLAELDRRLEEIFQFSLLISPDVNDLKIHPEKMGALAKWSKDTIKKTLPFTVRRKLYTTRNSATIVVEYFDAAINKGTERMAQEIRSVTESVPQEQPLILLVSGDCAKLPKVMGRCYDFMSTRCCLLLLLCQSKLLARAIVPQSDHRKGFNAMQWMESVRRYFPSARLKPGKFIDMCTLKVNTVDQNCILSITEDCKKYIESVHDGVPVKVISKEVSVLQQNKET